MRRLAVLLAATLPLSLLTTASLVAPTPAGAGGTSFSDVQASNPFFGHITWLAEEGIAEGFPDGGFHPTAPISRGAMAAFLYRVAGEPAHPDPSSPTFPDVPTHHPFFTEVEWLAAEQITTGFADGTFRSTAPTSRQAMAAYLYRSSGEPPFSDPGSPSFPDVPTTSLFFTEVEWLVDARITTGFPDGGFHPVDPVSRQAMAAFVFRQQHQDPTIDVDELLTGRFLPWDLAWTPGGQMLFTERAAGLRIRQTNGTVTSLANAGSGALADLLAQGETGIMGLTLDPDFTTNRTFYTCQGEQDEGPGDPGANVQLVQWTLAGDSLSVTKEAELVEMAPWPGSPGRHGGCRPRFGPDGHLWLTAGDTACGRYPQDLTAHAGKVLRIDVDPATETASAPADNPFVGGTIDDDLVYTYGHRNPQGLALRPGTTQMWSVEHGPGVDDEVNLLQSGGNYGWHPISTPGSCSYDEGVPMTDLIEFPDAIPAAWDSDGPTIASSGGTWLEGASWGGWEGAFIVANLAGSHARVLFFTDSGVLVEQRRPSELDGTFGRLRTPQMGPNEDLFLTTGNGAADRILRISATP